MNTQLNEWNLPHGTEPHNPDGLTPEQITEGGLYRATAEGEYLPKGSQVWNPYEGWINTGFVGHYAGGSALRRLTFRVPITTPLPAVKESATPQPAPAVAQSETAKSNSLEERLRGAILEQTWAAYNCGRVWEAWNFGTMSESDFSPFSESENVEGLVTDIQEILESELTATQRRLDEEVKIKLEISDREIAAIALSNEWAEKHYVAEEAIKKLQSELTAALAERDEARRLLGEAETSLGIVISAVQEWCDSVDADSSWDGWDSDYKNMKWHVLPKEKEILQQITNHLKTA